MQTFRYGAVFAATVIVAASTANVASAATYNSPNGYKITPPAGWTTQKNTAGTEVMFLSRTRENLNVVSQIVPKGTTLEAARSSSIVLLKRMMSGYKVVAQSTTILGGQRALTLTSSYMLSSPPQKLRAHQVFTIRNGKLFVFTCTAKDASYGKFAGAFNGALASIRWTK